MAELRLVWDQVKGRADISLVNGQLDLSVALETWVIVSLFTDRLAEDGDAVISAPDGTIDKRGWWADTLLGLDHPGDRIGSRLWLLERAKSNERTPMIAQGYIIEALQWMLDDGVASAVNAVCAFIEGDTSKLRADVTIDHVSGRRLNYRYDWAWRELAQAA